MPAKLPDNCYLRGSTIWGRITVAGCEHRRSLRTNDPKEARLRLAAWRKKVERSHFDIEEGHTFKAAVLKWGSEVLPGAVKPAVARRYLTSIAALKVIFGDKKVAEITSRDIARYISSRSGAVTNATIHRDITALSRLLAACAAWGWISSNPAKTHDLSIIRQKPKKLTIPDERDFQTALAFVPAGVAPILEFLDQTGMRSNEAVTLEWRDVNERLKQILLQQTKTGRPRALNWKTHGGDAGPILAALKRETEFVFPSGDDISYHSFSSVFGNAMRRLVEREDNANRAFRRFRVHDLRHRFAIRWLKAGGDIYRLSRHLGHSSVKTTEIYLEYLTDDEIDVIRGLAQKTAQQPTKEMAEADEI